MRTRHTRASRLLEPAVRLLAAALLLVCTAVSPALAADGQLGTYDLEGGKGEYPVAKFDLPSGWEIGAGTSRRAMEITKIDTHGPLNNVLGGVGVRIYRITPGSKWDKRGDYGLASIEEFRDYVLQHGDGAFLNEKSKVTGPEVTTLGGQKVWIMWGEYYDEDLRDEKNPEIRARRAVAIFVPQGKGRVFVDGAAGSIWRPNETGDYGPRYEEHKRSLERFVNSLVFLPMDEEAGAAPTGGETNAPGEAPKSGLPWRTAGAGTAAVAAAAAAILGASIRTRPKGQKADPDQTIGYILQLDTRALHVSPQASANLKVDVWEVAATGAYRPAAGAQVTLATPQGISASPAQGTRSLTAQVRQSGDAESQSTLTVTAQAAGGGTQATVAVYTQADSRIKVDTEPAGARLTPDGRDIVKLVARVILSAEAQADPAVDANAVAASIEFASGSAWADMSAAVPVPGGKAINLAASQPDPVRPQAVPDAVWLTVTAQVGQQRLSENVTVELAGTPSIDARPDRLEFTVEDKAEAEVTIWIEEPGPAPWRFRAVWADGSIPVAQHRFSAEEGVTTTLTLTEDAKDKLPPQRPSETSTLRVLAERDGADPLERHVKVTVLQEGLFIDGTGRHPDGTFHIAADGSGDPTDIDVRVFALDAEGRVALDEQSSCGVEWKPASTEGSAGAAALGHDDLEHISAGIRESNSSSAIHRFAYPRVLPTDGTPVPAVLEATVPGRDKPAYTKQVAISLVGPATLPYTDAWFKERDACLKIIYDFVPAQAQPKFVNLVMERGKTMGAEGLFEMRKRFWAFARNSLMAEHEDYMYRAQLWEQAEGLADWVSWCADIAVGVATGTLVGTSAAFAIGVIKPSLVNAMDVWTKGGSIDDWARGQLGVAVGTAEGVATDIDLLVQKIPGGKTAAWTVFICYWFVRELMRDPDMSVKNAMLNVCRMVRDQALTSFLRGVFGTKPGMSVVPDDGPRPTPPKPGERPAGWRPAGDTSAVKGRPPKGGREPKPGEPKGTPDGKRPRPAGEEPAAPPASGDKQAPTAKPAPVKPGKTMGGPAASKLVRDNIRMKNGKPQVDIDTMSRIMRDPDAAREMRRSDPEAYQAYENTRAEVRRAHDAKLAQTVKDSVPGMKDKNIRVQTVGTEGGIDRDFHVQMEVPDPRNPGGTMWIEVPKEQWQGASQKIFAEATGGPSDPDGAAKWSHDHQQVGGDSYIGEAAIDMAGEATITGPDGKPVRVQITPHDQQVMNVKPGHAGEPVTLHDPDGYGKTWETKVAESSKAGALDGYAQAKKAVDALDKVRSGYANQSLDVGDLPPDVAQGARTVRLVAEGKLSVEEGDAALRNMKLGSLPDFMGKVSAQFGALKWAK